MSVPAGSGGLGRRRSYLTPRWGGGHSGLNGYPLPNDCAERKRSTPTFSGGQLLLGQKRGVVNFELRK